MKKSILLIASAFIAFSSFAGGNGYLGTKKKGEGVLSNGFYLNLGVSFPSAIYTQTKSAGVTVPNATSYVYSMGVQPNLEIGNQWYFWHNDKFGIGLKVSWLQLGYSSYSQSTFSSAITSSTWGNFEARFLKLAPEFTFAVNEDLAFDASFEFATSINAGGGVNRYSSGSGYDITTTQVGFGYFLSPGIRARYKVFALGFDYGFGTVNYAAALQYSSNTTGPGTAEYTNVVANPRIYLGFQF